MKLLSISEATVGWERNNVAKWMLSESRNRIKHKKMKIIQFWSRPTEIINKSKGTSTPVCKPLPWHCLWSEQNTICSDHSHLWPSVFQLNLSNEFFTGSCQTDMSFVRTSTVKGLLYLKVQIKFCFYCIHSHPISIKLSTGDVHKNLLSDSRFCVNWNKKMPYFV